MTDDELVEQECKDIDNEKKSYSELESVRQDIISEPMNEIEKPDVISSVQCDIDFITNEIFQIQSFFRANLSKILQISKYSKISKAPSP